MQFFYHKNSGADSIKLEKDDAHYLFNVRRFKGGILEFRNLQDFTSYFYELENKNTFRLIDSKPKNAQKNEIILHLAMIDTKDIYDVIVFLNELNVGILNIFYGDFSQKNRKLDSVKMQKILRYSSMQCGRFDVMQINILKDLGEILASFPNAYALDFNCNKNLVEMQKNELQDGIIIGPEGGFSPKEREILKNKTISIESKNILKSQTALVQMASFLSFL